MIVAFVAIGVIITLFGWVVLRGSPYVPTLPRDIARALDVANLPKGSVIVDLGSGDGALLKAAAQRGLKAVGYELNPLLVLVTRWRCRKFGNLVQVRTRDFWLTPLPDDTAAVFVFLNGRDMAKLEAHLTREAARLQHSFLLLSYAFELPHRKLVRRDKAILCYEITP